MFKQSSALAVVMLAVTSVACQKPERSASRESTPPVTPPQSATATSAGGQKLPSVEVGGAVECHPIESGLTKSLTWIVRAADSDADGRLARSEAESLADFLVGGFVFRADANMDGNISADEARQARMDFLRRQPGLDAVLRGVRDAGGGGAADQLMKLLDVDAQSPITTADARAAALGAVSAVFKVADLDRDDFITQTEARTAAAKQAKSLGERLFQAADANNDGFLDTKEFEKPVDRSAELAFHVADRNDDGKLTSAEAQAAIGGVVRRLGLDVSLPD